MHRSAATVTMTLGTQTAAPHQSASIPGSLSRPPGPPGLAAWYQPGCAGGHRAQSAAPMSSCQSSGCASTNDDRSATHSG